MASPSGVPSRTVELRDGSKVTVRAVRADDGPALQAAIGELSRESRYSRFFSAMPELPAQMLEQATHPDPAREVQLVALDADGEIVAGTRYTAIEPQGTCEFAIAVVDEWQGRGLARLLLETLMDTARKRGVSRMEGEILRSNTSMLGLAKRLGFKKEDEDDPAVVRVTRDLGAIDA